MEDLIKRSDVWNITAILHSEFITIEQEQILERIDEMVDGLPSADRPQLDKDLVEPIGNGNVIMSEDTYEELLADRPQGEWIGEADGYADGEPVYDTWYCSNCDYVVDDGEPPTWNFCPNCGCRMRKE